MYKHTKLPWTAHGQQVSDTSEHRVSIAYCGEVAGAGVCKDGKIRSFRIDESTAKANAALIVKAANNHEALFAFFKWAMKEGPWDGCDLDGASIQYKAEALGLIVKTKYDAEKHGEAAGWMFQDGDDWYEIAPHLTDDLIPPRHTNEA